MSLADWQAECHVLYRAKDFFTGIRSYRLGVIEETEE